MGASEERNRLGGGELPMDAGSVSSSEVSNLYLIADAWPASLRAWFDEQIVDGGGHGKGRGSRLGASTRKGMGDDDTVPRPS